MRLPLMAYVLVWSAVMPSSANPDAVIELFPAACRIPAFVSFDQARQRLVVFEHPDLYELVLDGRLDSCLPFGKHGEAVEYLGVDRRTGHRIVIQSSLGQTSVVVVDHYFRRVQPRIPLPIGRGHVSDASAAAVRPNGDLFVCVEDDNDGSIDVYSVDLRAGGRGARRLPLTERLFMPCLASDERDCVVIGDDEDIFTFDAEDGSSGAWRPYLASGSCGWQYRATESWPRCALSSATIGPWTSSMGCSSTKATRVNRG
eukprot:TRINITY_DN21325_c0_g1_i1.p1 TRINITY_DN21325_c0_g1~~TRINITY_DN21325_c0_g1_i1.p1  ORF type:complete len:258 (-),score=26.71 TRINITY_DN21325_c0_g1_i1:157-930(-)